MVNEKLASLEGFRFKTDKKDIENRFLYDEEVKREYLNEMVESGDISEETSKNYERILLITSELEDRLKKDLNQFTLKELEVVLFGFGANNRNTIETYARIISSYLNWSVKEGYTSTNFLTELKPDDFIKYLTNSEEYFTYKQLKRWENQMVNAQDAVVTHLLFLGVGGKQMSEIRNLKRGDVDRARRTLRLTNTLKADKDTGLPIEFTKRTLENVDDDTFDLIEEALRKKTYEKKNGKMVENPHVRLFTDLVDNNYVVRSSITKTDNYSYPVDKFVIYRRITVLSEMIKGMPEDLTAKLIQRSGMIYYGHELMKDDGELSLNKMKMVAERFNIKSYHNLKGFLTVENILKTYPEKS